MIDFRGLQAQIFEDMNWVRTFQTQVATYLSTGRLPMYQGIYVFLPHGRTIKTLEGSLPVQELILQLKASGPMSSLNWSSGLAKAATTHAFEMGINDHYLSRQPQSKSLEDRLRLYCDVTGKAMQLIQLAGVQSKQVLFQLLIDDGLASRSRRRAILNPNFRHVGIGISKNRKYGHVIAIVLAQNVVEIQPPPQPLPVILNPVPPFEIVVTPPPQYTTPVIIQQTPLPVFANLNESNLIGPPVEIRPNRLLHAYTYDKNLFGGQNEQFCLLF